MKVNFTNIPSNRLELIRKQTDDISDDNWDNVVPLKQEWKQQKRIIHPAPSNQRKKLGNICINAITTCRENFIIRDNEPVLIAVCSIQRGINSWTVQSVSARISVRSEEDPGISLEKLKVELRNLLLEIEKFRFSSRRRGFENLRKIEINF